MATVEYKKKYVHSLVFVHCHKICKAELAESAEQWALDWMARFRFLKGQGIFLFCIVSRLVLGSTQSPVRWVLEALSSGVK
jgi:hypothetical protein